MRRGTAGDPSRANEPRRLRLFVAVFPPPEVQRTALSLEDALRRPDDRVSWVKLENLHYTMRFIGEVGEDGARRVAAAADEAASDVAAFEAVLGGLGAFPNARRARVLWVSLTEGAEPLKALARSLEEALGRRGFDRADHRFSPHLTLGRVREPGPDWTERLAATRVPDGVAVRFRIDRLCVIESKLSPKGSTYTVRHEAMLKEG